MPKIKILIVEDVSSIAAALALEISLIGHQSERATDGFEALQSLIRNNFDIVIVDLTLPGFDGIQLTRKIRSLESGNSTQLIPILGMSVVIDQNQLLEWEVAGLNKYLPKDFSRAELRTAIDEILKEIGHT